jgi:1-deoxy-D-xylulose-5-phosphate reductoisomerase
MVKKKIVLLGATGSIGKSTLEVVREQSDKLEIVLATAHSKAAELYLSADKLNIPNLVITDEQAIRAIPPIISNRKIYRGEDELLKLLNELEYDIAINAISGSAGLRSTMAILQRGKTLALANKESLVMAGHLVKTLQAKHGSAIIPVDSEHSAIFQAIGKHLPEDVSQVYITASGGAFRSLPLEDFDKITVEQALKHPNWDMGAKVTLDSATMFNKALEVMEAHWLFILDWEQIRAVIHPQSVIHSLVEFRDGSLLAQMSVPDMKLPILYALSYPERYESQLVKTDLLKLPALTFEEISPQRYPLFYLGIEAGRQGGILPTIANAANEAALKLFTEGRIRFVQISQVVEQALATAVQISNPALEEIININSKVYKETLSRY